MIFDKATLSHPMLLLRTLPQRLRNDSLLRNSIFIMGTTVATSAIGYLYWIAAAHLFSPHDVGLASALISVMLLTSTLANLGIGSTLVQVLPRAETDADWSLTLNAGLTTGAISGLLAGGIVVVALPLFSAQFAIVRQPLYALLFIISIPLGIATTLADQTFVAERASSGMLIRNAAFAILKLVLMVLPVLFIPIGAAGIFAAYVAALALSLVGVRFVLLARLRRHYLLSMHGIGRRVRMMLSSLAGNHFINIGGLATMGLLPVFVTMLLSAADNAYYYTTSMVGDFFFMVTSAVAVSLFAEGSHAADELGRKVRSSTVIMSALLIPSMLVVFLGGQYILLLFGPGYVQHGLPVLRIDTIAAVPDAITNVYISVLRVQGRLRIGAILNLGMAAITLVLAWMLLPVLGIAGAAWAFFIAQSVGSVVTGLDYLRFRLRKNQLPPTIPAARHDTELSIVED